MPIEIQVGDTVLRSVPVAAAAGLDVATSFLGLSLDDWFYISAIGYTFIQAWSVIYKTLKAGKASKS